MRAGTTLIIIGLAIVAIGVIVRFAPWLVSWFGKLPGDVRIESDSTRMFIPITSMLVVSLLASLVLGAISRFRG